MTDRFDMAIVGAGMAGASLAAELAGEASVLLLEAEERPGYHATGRSAAFWTESYGGPQIQPLTTASRAYLAAQGVLAPRGALTIARDADAAGLDAFAERFAALGVRVERLGQAALGDAVGGLRAGWTGGVFEPDCSDIDVAALHQHYLSRAAKEGAELWSRARLTAARHCADGWQLELADGREARCAVLVNAAGAWADGVALTAGVELMGMQPFRRTMVQLRTEPAPPAILPLVLDYNETFYFKPESGRLWLSPHDETPSAPCDAAAEEIDVAEAIDRLEQVVDWRIAQVEHRWAGLRTFMPDRLPVYGYDQRAPDFFWFAGQGGFGIQTAPAAARLGAALLLRRAPGGEVDPSPYSPSRKAL